MKYKFCSPDFKAKRHGDTQRKTFTLNNKKIPLCISVPLCFVKGALAESKYGQKSNCNK